MITPAVTVALIIIGWSAAAVAMLWGMRRVSRYHQRSEPNSTLPRFHLND